MSESASEMMSRLEAMAVDINETWDLSPKDQAAIKHVLESHVRILKQLKRLVDVLELMGMTREQMADAYAAIDKAEQE